MVTQRRSSRLRPSSPPPADPVEQGTVDQTAPGRRVRGDWRFWRRGTAPGAEPDPGTEPGTHTGTEPGGPTACTEPGTAAESTAGSEPGDPPAAADPWQSFAPALPSGTPWYARCGEWLTERVIALLTAEMTRVCAIALAVAAGMNWPLLRHPGHAMPGAAGEGTGPAWWLGWLGRAVRSTPSSLTDAASYAQVQYPDAGTEPLFGYLPLAVLGSGPAAAVARYAMVVVLAGAIASIGGYALARQLGANPAAAAVAGAALGYPPLRLGQTGHLGVLSVGILALGLAALARGHGWSLVAGYDRDRCGTAMTVFGWLVLIWQISLGAAVAVPVGYTVAALAVVSVIGWLVMRRPSVPLRIIAVDVLGAAAAGAATVGMVSLARTVGNVAGNGPGGPTAGGLFASPLALVTAPDRSLLWGAAHATARSTMADQTAMSLLPGFALLAMAVAGLVVSVWRWPARLCLAACGAGFAVLAMTLGGDQRGPGGALASVPGFGRVTVPATAQSLALMALAVLAAGACTALARSARATVGTAGTRTARAAALTAAVLPVAAVLAEGLPARATWTVARVPAAVAAVRGYPLLVLPSDDGLDGQATMWGTAGPWHDGRLAAVANGPGRAGTEQAASLRAAMVDFPSAESVAVLRQRRIATVVVLRTNAKDRGYINALAQHNATTLAALGLERSESDEAVVYTVQGL